MKINRANNVSFGINLMLPPEIEKLAPRVQEPIREAEFLLACKEPCMAGVLLKIKDAGNSVMTFILERAITVGEIFGMKAPETKELTIDTTKTQEEIRNQVIEETENFLKKIT